MQVVVSDRGHGIRATLRRNPAYQALASDTEAILRSVRLGVSEHEDRMRGNGLYHLMELAYKHEGAVHIRSGSGKVYLRTDQRTVRQFLVPELQGTQFSITFPAKTLR
jgi:sensor histidine kinase regulating citrate/malate metabolism